MSKKGKDDLDPPDSRQTLSNLCNEAIHSPIMLDAPRTVLWDHHPCGPPILISLSHYKNPALLIKDRILGLASHYLERMKKDKVSCLLIGSVGFAEGSFDEGVRITLNQFEENQAALSTVPGDIIVPTMCGWKCGSSFKPEMEQYLSDLKYVYHSASEKPLLDIANFIRIRIYCTFQGIHCSIQTEMITAATSFKATPVPPIPMIRTSFIKDLAGPRSNQTPQTGFLTMDQAKRLLLVLEHDVKVSSLPLVGIWASGIAKVSHPFVWASCVRYISLSSLQNRLCLPPQPFLIAIFSPLHSQPEFYDCITSTGSKWLTFDVFRGKAATSLAKVPISNSRITVFEMNKVLSKELLFEEALKKVSRVTAKPVCNASVISNLDDMPQLCPSPEALKNISVQHLVPDLSLLSDIGICEPASEPDCMNPAFSTMKEQPLKPVERCIPLVDKSSFHVFSKPLDTELQQTTNIRYGLHCDVDPVHHPSVSTVPEEFQQSCISQPIYSTVFEKVCPHYGLHQIPESREEIHTLNSNLGSLVPASSKEQNGLLNRDCENVHEPGNKNIYPIADSNHTCPSNLKNTELLARNSESKNSPMLNEEEKLCPTASGTKFKQANQKVTEPSEASPGSINEINLPEQTDRKQRSRASQVVKNNSPPSCGAVGKKGHAENIKSCLYRPDKLQKQKPGDVKLHSQSTAKKPSKRGQKRVEFKEHVQKFGTEHLSSNKLLPKDDSDKNKGNLPTEELPHVYSLLQHQDQQLRLLQEKINILLQTHCPQSNHDSSCEIPVTPAAKSPAQPLTDSSLHPQSSLPNQQGCELRLEHSLQDKSEDRGDIAQASERTKPTCCMATMTSFSWPIHPEPKQCSDECFQTDSVYVEEGQIEKSQEVAELNGLGKEKHSEAYNLKITKDKHIESRNNSEAAEHQSNAHQQQTEHNLQTPAGKSNSRVPTADDTLLSLEDLHIETVYDQMTSPAPSVHIDIQDFPASEYSQNVQDSNQGNKISSLQKKEKRPLENKTTLNSLESERAKDPKHMSEDEDKSIPDKTFYRNIVGNVHKILSRQGQQKCSKEESVSFTFPKHPCFTANRRLSTGGGHCYQCSGRMTEECNFPHSKSITKHHCLKRNINSSSHISSAMVKNHGYKFSETDLSLAVNTLAAKYFGDEWMPSAHFSKATPCAPLLQNMEDYCMFGKVVEFSIKDYKPSDLTLYGMSSSNLSFATKKYLEKHGLSSKPSLTGNAFLEDEETSTSQVSVGDREINSDTHLAEVNNFMNENSATLSDPHGSPEQSLWVFGKPVKQKTDKEALETADKVFSPSPAESNILDVNALRQQPKLL